MAAIFTFFLGVAAVVLSYFINQFNTSTLLDRVEVAISSDWGSFQDWQQSDPLLSVPEIIDRMGVHHDRSYFSYQNPDGDFEYGSIQPQGADTMRLDDNILLMMISEQHLLSRTGMEGIHRFAGRYHELPNGGRLLIARDIESPLLERRRMQQLGLITIVLMLLVIAFSFFISTYVVGLTNNISNTANEIMETGDFSRRIPVERGGDDLSDLANMLNDMLAKTENLMLSVRQVSDNIAHDLRTPLSRLRNKLDDLDEHLKKLDDEQAAQMTESVIREADHILGTFGALLRIARIESGKKEQDFENIDLQPLLEDILELYEPLAEEKGIAIEAKIGSVVVPGDGDMLFQVFGNLLDNAIKFSPENSEIEVVCRYGRNQALVEIADCGAGISDEDKTRVFDRFYRAEKSRNTPGNGLGLSLVQAVMGLHKAQIRIVDNKPGARFIISMQAEK